MSTTVDYYDFDSLQNEYENGFQSGFDACQKRYIAILKRFPLQCAAISARLPLHPSQPDVILEPEEPLKLKETEK